MTAPSPPPPTASFARRFLALAGGYWMDPAIKWRVRGLTLAMFGLTVVQVIVPVLINLWSQRLFDALEQRSMDRFLTMVGMVVGIIALNIANTIAHLRTKRRLQLGWRDWMTQKLLDGWLSRGRHLQITFLGGQHDNPDGRIAEDIRITTEAAIDLALSLIYCGLLLISFTSILWQLSGDIELTMGGISFVVPGYLLFIALIYAVAGTTIAVLVGRPLVRSVNRRQHYEADFRFGLARVRENALPIALLHGESEERRRLTDLFVWVKSGWHGQTRGLSNMMIFSAAYSVLSAAFPVLVAAPRYISGAISLGVLMQTAQAFQQTVAALSWPIDNIPRAAEWQASVERVLDLHEALIDLNNETLGAGNRIVVDRTLGDPTLSMHALSLCDPDGQVLVAPFDLEIHPGERVLISGDPGAAVRLFKAVARVWPWGSGRIDLPAQSRIFIMPQRPYMPRGPLQGVLSYPEPSDRIDSDSAAEALRKVGLEHLVERLDQHDVWEDALAVAEQQRLGFARLLVGQPDWIFLESATDALDAASEEEMLRLLDRDFASATLLTIGNHLGLEAHHRRKLVFDRSNGIAILREQPCRSIGGGLWDPAEALCERDG